MVLQMFLQNPRAVGLQRHRSTVGTEECVRGRKAEREVKFFVLHPRKSLGRKVGDFTAWGSRETILWCRHSRKLGAYVSCQPGRQAPGISGVVTAANCPETASNET